jgi:hypothetical protein
VERNEVKSRTRGGVLGVLIPIVGRSSTTGASWPTSSSSSEVEGIHYAPSLDLAVEDRPAQQSADDHKDEGAQLRTEGRVPPLGSEGAAS